MSGTLSVAIVGSGPAAFYVAEALLDADLPLEIDIIERLPVPFGLVRYGVAPDHQKLKAVTAVFTRVAQSPRVAFFGNVEVGDRLGVADLVQAYEAVVVATGAMAGRAMDVPGEDLPGSISATDFVGWYNGHPDFQDLTFDLSHPSAVVIGNGNVAIDVCRILSKSVDELRSSDIGRRALEALAESRITDIHLVGRRGPAQSKFTTKELRELGELADTDPVVDPAGMELDDVSQQELAVPASAIALRNVEILRGFAARAGGAGRSRRVHFHFLLSPVRIEGRDSAEAVVFERNRLSGSPFRQRCEPTGDTVRLPAGLVIRSVGYRGAPIPGVPFDPRSATIPHVGGRVIGDGGITVPNLYTAGWIKRGPSGVIGSNRACGLETAEAMIADLRAATKAGAAGRDGRSALRRMLAAREITPVDFEGWLRIDALESRAGALSGKPREKLTRVHDMLSAAAPTPAA
jgi:ferredoxin--NADP+ reductase